MNVHQALHGYSDGHKLLTSSVSLSARDAKTVLFMSDASAPGNQINESGYLTGYPLSESGLYALARTWPAREMPRPGCVWTHTLLVDFSDLALLDEPEGLCTLFRRPVSGDSFGYYGVPLEISGSLQSNCREPVTENIKSWWRRIILGIYSKSSESVFVNIPADVSSEVVVLGIWGQQWPRLRRNFRFCTFTVDDRSSELGLFDLQVVATSGKGSRTRIPNTIVSPIIKHDVDSWVEHALSDLVHPNESGLRSFLRVAGAETQEGREIFAPLCNLHDIMTSSLTAVHINNAIMLFNRYLKGLSLTKIKKQIAELSASNIENLTAESYMFLIENLDEIDDSYATTIGRNIWKHDLDAVASMFLADGIRRQIGEAALVNMDEDTLWSLFEQHPLLISDVISLRPTIMNSPAFWDLSKNLIDITDALHLIPEKQKRKVLQAIVSAGSEVQAKQVIKYFGSKEVLSSISDVWPEAKEQKLLQSLNYWLHEAVSDGKAVASFLEGSKNLMADYLVSLAKVTEPDLVPSIGNSDPWLIAIDRVTTMLTKNQNIFLSSYLLSRAFSRYSKHLEAIVVRAFEPVHTAAQLDMIDNSAWQLLVHRLPRVPFWTEWDRCKRLRAGLIRLFVDNKLSPLIFGELPVTKEVFTYMAREAAEWPRGRRFLREVRIALKASSNSDAEFRRHILKEVL